MKNSHEKAGTGRKKYIHINKLRRKKQKIIKKITRTYG